MKIVYWNIKAKDKCKSTYNSLVIKEIEKLFNEDQCDLLILSECTALSFSELKINPPKSISYIDPDHLEKTKFNIRILHNEKIKISHSYNAIFNDIKRKNKGSTKLTGNIIKTGILMHVSENEIIENPVTIIASHWTYKGNPTHENVHKKAAQDLKEIADNEITEGRPVILIGDYNRTTEEMKNNTCLDISMNKFYVEIDYYRFYDLSHYFYTQHSSYELEGDNNGFGTFTSSKTRTNENSCSVIDHVYVSSSLVSQGCWTLDEDKTKAIFNAGISNLMYNVKDGIDHLPISLEINHEDRI